jgi:hypothetical protein
LAGEHSSTEKAQDRAIRCMNVRKITCQDDKSEFANPLQLQ